MCRRFVQSINFASEKFFDSCRYCQYKTPFAISSYSWFRYAPTIRRRHPTTNDGRDAEKAPSLRNGSRDFRCRCLCRPTPVSHYVPRSFVGVCVGGVGVPPSITVLPPIVGGVNQYLLAKRSKGSLSFFFSYPPSMMIQFGQKETGRIKIILA